MTFLLKKIYFQLQIKWLIFFNATLLFDKINQLYWYQNMLHEWIDKQNITAKSKVLEVGCASGDLTAYMANSGYVPTGVDYSSKMIESAKGMNDGIDFVVANALDLPFEADCFDVVIAASLINIVADKSQAIYQLSRACKKGGLITVLVPSAEFDDTHLISLQASLGNAGFSFAALEVWHKRAPKMQASDIVNLFKQAGLRDMTTKKYLQGMVVSVSAIKPSNDCE